MNEGEAIVRRSSDDYVWVELREGAGCGSCKSQGGCGSGLLGLQAVARQYRVRNTVGAQVGDIVQLSVPDGAVLKAALAAYLMPLLCGLCGAAVAASWGGTDGHAVLGLLAGLAAGLPLLRWYGRRGEPASILQLKRHVIRLHKEA